MRQGRVAERHHQTVFTASFASMLIELRFLCQHFKQNTISYTTILAFSYEINANLYSFISLNKFPINLFLKIPVIFSVYSENF